MRLCGHDCVVRGRYDRGSAGSGRYFYRLDPQDPLNFGIIFSNLSIYARWRGYPHAGCRIGTHRVHGGTYGAGKGQTCNARAARSFIARDLSAIDQNHLTHWHKGGRQGGGLGSTLGSTKRGRRNATAQPCEASQALTRSARQPTNRSQSDNWHSPHQIPTRQGLTFITSGHETRNATGPLSSDHWASTRSAWYTLHIAGKQ